MPTSANILSMHKYYDLMFKDVRQQLDVQLGDP